jgi:hypothetical protein
MVAIAICCASVAAAFSIGGQKDDRGKELVLEACTACHTLDRVRIQRLTREEWRQEIAGMLSEGVPLSDDEIDLVVTYLAEHFGPDNR